MAPEEIKIKELEEDLQAAAAELQAVTAELEKQRREAEALREGETRYRMLFDKMAEGFALHEIVLDGEGRPCDYRFLEINPAFERLTGLKQADVIGRGVREVLPGIEEYWIEICGKVALTGEAAQFENYAAPLGRWYEVFAYRTAEKQFAVVFVDISERKRTEEALAAAHQRIQSIIDNTPDIVYAFDLEERFLLANAAVAKVLGSTPEEMIGKRRHEFMPREDADRHEVNDRQVIEAGKPLELEEYSQLKGRSITWLTKKFPLRDAQGKIYALAGISADVSERKKAEEALRRERGMLDSVMTATDVQIAYLDREFNFVFANAAYAEAAGVPAEALIGRNHFAIFPHEENEAIFRQVRDSGEAVFYKDKPFEYPGQPERGVTYWDWSLVPVTDEAGRVEGVVLSLRETTEFVRVQKAVRESEGRLRLATDASGLGIFEWNAVTDEPVWENERMFEIFGMTPTEAPLTKERFIQDALHPDARERFEAELAESMRTRSLFRGVYRIRRRSDGEWRWIEFFSRFEFTSEGEASRLVGVLEDVTERKEVEAAVRRLAQFPEENPNAVLRVANSDALLYANKPGREFLATMGWRPDGVLPAILLELAGRAAEQDRAIDDEISTPEGRTFSVSATRPPQEDYVNFYVRDVTERKRVEESVREANEVIARQLAEIESIYHGAAVGLCVLDADHRWVRINEQLAEINGYSVDEHIGRRMEELVPDVARAVKPLFDRIIATGEPVLNFEFQAETKARPGVVRDFVEHWLPLKDESGRVFAVNIVVQEVTERKQAEREIARINEELRAANEDLAAVNEELHTANEELAHQTHDLAVANQRLESARHEIAEILESITECYLLLDRDWRILDMNANSARVIFGGLKERFIGTLLWNLTKGELKQNEFRRQYSRAFEEGRPVHFEAHSHIADERWFEVHAYPSEDKATLAVYFHDISDRKRAQLEAVMANEELGGMNEELQASNDELARANEEVRFANEQLKERTRELETANEQLDQRKEELAEVNSRLVRANQDLLEANTELGRFGAYLSHDLRAPLRTIRGFSEIFIEDYGEQLDEEGRELAERMMRAAEKAGEIIADIERLTGLDAVTFAPEEIDLRDIAQAWHASLRAREPERECRLELAGELQARADRRLMTAALTNLFENAFKYSAERDSAVITFGSESRGAERVFYVKDNGAGFDMKQAEKLFKPFSRLHDSSTFTGTGLGLAIVRKVIVRHGGRVWAEGSPGTGATFYFTVGE